MHLAKLCIDIQHNAELSITKIVEEHLIKQNKHKNSKKKKSKNKRAHNFKPRFQPIEHSPSSRTYSVPKTDIITMTQNMQLGLKKHIFTTATQYNLPILKTTATQCTHPTFKTTATLPISQNHSSTYTQPRHLPLNTTAMLHQPNTHDTLKRTYTSAPSDNHHLSKRSFTLTFTLTYTPNYNPSTIQHIISTNL